MGMLSIVVRFFLSFLVVISVARAELDASFDVDPPDIADSVPINSSAPGSPLTIDTIVRDNIGVREVNVYYRNIGDSKFHVEPMTSSDNEHFRFSIPPERMTAPGIEYYLEARDSAGNSTLRGYESAPLTVHVKASTATENLAETSISHEAISFSQPSEKQSHWKWVLGAVLITGLVAGIGGGGGGGSDSGKGPDTPPEPQRPVDTTISGARYPGP